MNHKFTSDGRKVAIIGALNAKETIVQEVFITDGTEFPAGEHFVVKTLLDAPAETYKAKEERRILEDIKKHEIERDRLKAELSGYRFKAAAAVAKMAIRIKRFFLPKRDLLLNRASRLLRTDSHEKGSCF